MSPATTPSNVKGSISKWVVFELIFGSRKAIKEFPSSLTSRNSTSPSLTKSSKLRSPSSNSYTISLASALQINSITFKCLFVTRGLPLYTMISGRHIRPESDAIYIQRCPALK